MSEDQNVPVNVHPGEPTPVNDAEFTQPGSDAGETALDPQDPVTPSEDVTTDPVNDDDVPVTTEEVTPEEAADAAQDVKDEDPNDVTDTPAPVEPFSPHEDRLVDEDTDSDVCVQCQGKGLDLSDYSKLCSECDGSGKKRKKKSKK